MPRWFAIIVRDTGPDDEAYKDASEFLDAQGIDLQSNCEIETCVELNPCSAESVVFSVRAS